MNRLQYKVANKQKQRNKKYKIYNFFNHINQKRMKFKQKYSLKQRQQKFLKQMQQDKDKILIIAEKHPKSKLPQINPKFLCDRKYKFNMIKAMLQKKVKQQMQGNKLAANESFFVFVNNKIPDGQQSMDTIYEKYKDEDGFLYIIYQDMEDKGGY